MVLKWNDSEFHVTLPLSMAFTSMDELEVDSSLELTPSLKSFISRSNFSSRFILKIEKNVEKELKYNLVLNFSFYLYR